jgi:hypothetical protein
MQSLGLNFQPLTAMTVPILMEYFKREDRDSGTIRTTLALHAEGRIGSVGIPATSGLRDVNKGNKKE